MSVLIKAAGIYSTLQDEGRTDGMPQGIPISGAMDSHLFHFANSILNNPKDSSCIEFYQQGLELKFEAPTFVYVGALGVRLSLNDDVVDANKIIKIKTGDVLKILELTRGTWGYVAVKDGFESESFLGSQSFYKALNQHKFQNGDHVHFEAYDGENGGDYPTLDLDYYQKPTLDVYKGPEFDRLSRTLQYQLKHAEFSVSTSQNRMAYRIQERLDNELDEITTGPVLPGTVQYTPDGKMIVLMRDAQVTGGYPRILQLSEESINVLSQMRAKSNFKFNLIEINSEKT